MCLGWKPLTITLRSRHCESPHRMARRRRKSLEAVSAEHAARSLRSQGGGATWSMVDGQFRDQSPTNRTNLAQEVTCCDGPHSGCQRKRGVTGVDHIEFS